MIGDKAIDEPTREAQEPPGTSPRMSIRQIVVPTDLKPHGQKAMHYALALAQCFDATLTLVHIYDPAYTYAEAQEVNEIFVVRSDLFQFKRDIKHGVTDVH